MLKSSINIKTLLGVETLSLRASARTIVRSAVEMENEMVYLDFNEIEACSRSFTDELLVGLIRANITPALINTNPNVSMMIDLVVNRQFPQLQNKPVLLDSVEYC